MKYPEELERVRCKLFIDGQLVDSQCGKPYDVINPATEEVIAQAVSGTEQDVDLAAQAAKKAFK